MNIATALKTARKKKGLTQAELAEALGLSQPHLSEMEAGRRNVSDEVLAAAEKILGKLSVTRHEVIPITSRGTAVVPLYRTVVRAGKNSPIALEDTSEDFDIAKHYAGTAVYEVAGDSMIDAGIEEGDRLVVRLGYHFQNKDIILCRYNGELMVKGASILDRMIWLFPANKRYHAWRCKEDDEFQCIGIVVEVIKEPRKDWWSAVNFSKLTIEEDQG